MLELDCEIFVGKERASTYFPFQRICVIRITTVNFSLKILQKHVARIVAVRAALLITRGEERDKGDEDAVDHRKWVNTLVPILW